MTALLCALLCIAGVLMARDGATHAVVEDLYDRAHACRYRVFRIVGPPLAGASAFVFVVAIVRHWP